jgi:thiamine-phosphate pyrophosphorylase
MALLIEEEGRPAQLLLQSGVSIADLRVALQSLAAPPNVHSRLDHVFQLAAELARERSGERTIGTEHLLLAIVRNDERVRTTLQNAGVNAAKLEQIGPLATPPAIELDEPLDFDDLTPIHDVARVIDANHNRAREAIRVVEDYCRFVLNDESLSRETKRIRHELVQILNSAVDIPALTFRDVSGDVGGRIGTADEYERTSPAHVATANLKRAQEAIRSLEEYGKIFRPSLGTALERLRYRVYSLERSISITRDCDVRLRSACLYALISGEASVTSLDFLIAESAAGGVDMFQLREKNLTDRELVQRAHRVRQWTRQCGKLLIINDRPDIAKIVGADGVHLGQEDMPVQSARRIVGADSIIGVSTHNLEQVQQAVRDGANYIGVGPVFSSLTKDFAELAGLEFVTAAIRETSLPAFALGGISCKNISQVLAAGASRFAVSNELCQADEPGAVAAVLREMILQNSSGR